MLDILPLSPSLDFRSVFVNALSVAVMGATGAVGSRMAQLLEERGFPIRSIRFLASERSAGNPLKFGGEAHQIQPLRAEAFQGVQLVLASMPGTISKEWNPIAARAGAVVVDNSSAFRMDPAVPLVVPEVNKHAIPTHKGIIANPNCSTIQMVVALKPLHDAARIRRVIVSTYQSVSGAGQRGIDELQRQTTASVRDGQPTPAAKFPHTILGNCIPQVDDFLPSGFTKEEMKMVNETHKILEAPEIEVCPTCVRVPVPFAHSESVAVELERPLSVDAARALWANAPGVTLVDNPEQGIYPLATHATGRDDVFVGRVRQDLHRPNTLLFWCVSDNLRKGAATNAVQIAEEVARLGCHN